MDILLTDFQKCSLIYAHNSIPFPFKTLVNEYIPAVKGCPYETKCLIVEELQIRLCSLAKAG